MGAGPDVGRDLYDARAKRVASDGALAGDRRCSFCSGMFCTAFPCYLSMQPSVAICLVQLHCNRQHQEVS
jgi:hypothetical protein